MEYSEIQIDPNLNAEAYRGLNPANQPPRHDKQLQAIVIYKDESAVIGASNMVDRYWNGTVWYFDDLSKLETRKYLAAMRNGTGIRDIAYLGKHDKFVVCEDSGVIQVVDLLLGNDKKAQELRCSGYTCQHDNSVNSISIFTNNTHLVSGGADSCIKVWDMVEVLPSYSYHQAQMEEITCVAVQSDSNFVFASTSLDGDALLWDTRKSKPAFGLFNKGCGLGAVTWKSTDENIVVIGGADGSISAVDIRSPFNTLHHTIQFPRSVHRLLFDTKSNLVAGCCDSTEVKVFDSANNYKLVYEDSRHLDFVRGLAWNDGVLITCGWDDNVFRHEITKLNG